MTQKNPILKTENICISYKNNLILKDISIKLCKGETVCILGMSGSGKTTLFNVISGLLKPDSGKVYLNDTDITQTPGHISYMLQKDLLFEHKKIIDNVALPLIIKGETKKNARKKVYDEFARFGLDGCQMKYPHELSGGMKQRAALMRTYLASENVMLLDEPFSALDAITRASIHKWFNEVSQNLNLSTLMISHDIDEAIKLSDRIYVLSSVSPDMAGEIVINQPKDSRDTIDLSPMFLEYKKQILDLLNA